MKHIAFVTQSYKADFDECRLLCESIDRFAPDIDHFIFVNDEDEAMFARLCYGRHRVARKGTLLPRGFVRVPWKIAGHHFHISRSASLPYSSISGRTTMPCFISILR